MTDEFILKNCTRCEECYKIAKHMYGCGHKPYKGKWIAEIEECPKTVLPTEREGRMTLEEIIGIKQRKIDRINKVGERTGETYSENEIYTLKYLKELKTLRVELENNSKELEVYKKALELMAKDYYFDYLMDMCDDNVVQIINNYLEEARGE